MLSDALSEIVEELKKEITYYFAEPFANSYDQKIRERLYKVVTELDEIRKELDTPPKNSSKNQLL